MKLTFTARAFAIALYLVLCGWPTDLFAQPNRLEVVRAVAEQHAALLQANTEEANAEFTRLVAQAMPEEWGMLSKSGGEAGYTFANGVRVSHDVIVHRESGRQVDILGGAGSGRCCANPQWGPIDPQHYRPHNQFVPLSALPSGGHMPAPVPSPSPVPTPVPSVNLQAILDAIATLGTKVDRIEGIVEDLGGTDLAQRYQVEQVGAQVAQLAERVEAAHVSVLTAINLGEQMLHFPPEYRGSVFGVPVTLRPQR